MPRLTVELSDELAAELRAAADAHAVTAAEFAASALAAMLDDRRHAEVVAIATRVLSTDAAIVHRLGTA